MWKKNKNLSLIIVLAVLVGIYFMVQFTGGKSKSKSLRSELVEIDTAKVTKFSLDAKGEQIEIFQLTGTWKVKLSSGKVVAGSQSNIESILGALLTIEPSRVATRKESKWKEYEVDDSTATRVQVYEGSDKTLDIMLGKFGMTGQRAFHTFVRLYEDKEVYVAENFMRFSVPADAASYRKQELMSIDQDSLTAILFNYPGDSSFQLTNQGGAWFVNGQLSDSTSVKEYLIGLELLKSSNFEDDSEGITVPILTARYSFSNREDIIVEAYQKGDEWIINSSENKDGFFKDEKLMEKIFVGREDVM